MVKAQGEMVELQLIVIAQTLYDRPTFRQLPVASDCNMSEEVKRG